MSRDWCFTVFDMERFNFVEEKIKYVIWGREICPETKRKHLQCYAIFKKTIRIKGAQEALGIGKSHMEMKRGTRDQARAYCMKDNDYEEFGSFDPITKEDLFRKSIPFLKANYPEFYCRYHKGLDRLQDKGIKWRDISVTWLWGEPGVGKTRFVMGMEDVYKIDDPYEWWDGYEGENILLIDDFDRGTIPRKRLIHILDGYQLRLPIKGAFTYANWTKIFLTSNHDPRQWIATTLGMTRRIHFVEEM